MAWAHRASAARTGEEAGRVTTSAEMRKKPGPKGQKVSRVQGRDPTGREKRFAHDALQQALAGFMRKARVA